MNIKKLTMQNFLVYGNEEQSLNLSDRGLLLINGENVDAGGFEANGAGKSSSIEGIIYALYGSLPDGTSGDSVINRESGKGLKVTLTLEQAGHDYRIERYRKHKEFKNKTLLFQDDKEITGTSIKNTNQMIVNIIGINKETYLNSVVFGMGDISNFAEATDKEKKSILEDIANIAIYKKAQEVTKEELKEARDSLNDNNQKCLKLAYDIKTSESNRDHEKELIKQWELGKKRLKDSVDKAQQELDNLKMPNNLKEVIKELRENIKGRREDIEQSSHPINDPYYEKIISLNQALEKLKEAINQKNSIINEDTQQLDIIKHSEIAYCSSCGAPLDKVHRSQEIERLTSSIKEASELVNDYNSRLPSINEALTVLNAKHQEIKVQQNNVQATIHEANQEIGKLEDSLNSYLSILSQKQNMESTLANYTDMYHNYTSKPESKFDPEELKQLRKDLRKAEKDTDKLEQEVSKLEETVEVYSDRGVKSHVLDLVMPYINSQANYYLSQLTDNSISIKIDTQTTAGNGNTSDKLSISVNNVVGSSEYQLNSKGERRRIDLSIALALQDYVMSKTNTQTNFIAYDEVFDGLDSVGIERVISILKERVKDIPTIVVISHNDALKELFENVVTVRKEGGVATLVNQ